MLCQSQGPSDSHIPMDAKCVLHIWPISRGSGGQQRCRAWKSLGDLICQVGIRPTLFQKCFWAKMAEPCRPPPISTNKIFIIVFSLQIQYTEESEQHKALHVLAARLENVFSHWCHDSDTLIYVARGNLLWLICKTKCPQVSKHIESLHPGGLWKMFWSKL